MIEMRQRNTPLIPAKAGTQCFRDTVRPIARPMNIIDLRPQVWVPAYAGISGL